MAKVMKLINEQTGLMECRVCGAQHTANMGNGRFKRGAWQCSKGCGLPDNATDSKGARSTPMARKTAFHVTNRQEAFTYLAFRIAQESLGTPIENEPDAVRRYHKRLEQEAVKILKNWDSSMIGHWIADMRKNEPQSGIVFESCMPSTVCNRLFLPV